METKRDKQFKMMMTEDERNQLEKMTIENGFKHASEYVRYILFGVGSTGVQVDVHGERLDKLEKQMAELFEHFSSIAGTSVVQRGRVMNDNDVQHEQFEVQSKVQHGRGAGHGMSKVTTKPRKTKGLLNYPVIDDMKFCPNCGEDKKALKYDVPELRKENGFTYSKTNADGTANYKRYCKDCMRAKDPEDKYTKSLD